MRLIVPPTRPPARLGLLPGGFNPPTRAHVALAEAALAHVDHVLLVLPEAFPHKAWHGASFDQRVEMLRLLTVGRPGIGAAVSEGGLFIEMAREARGIWPDVEVHVLCGRDAAERIVGWDYGDGDTIERQLAEYRLLVAPRQGDYEPPPHLAHAIRRLSAGEWDDHASTKVRERAEGWRDLVPAEIAPMVESFY